MKRVTLFVVITLCLAAMPAVKAGAVLTEAADAPGASIRTVVVVGTLVDGGAECQALAGDDGETYTLTGDLGGYSVGDRVRVVGRAAEFSFCQQGTTLEVRNIRPAKEAAGA
jgi:hypothetical protein